MGCSPIKAARELGLERRTLRLHGAICGCPPAHIGGTLTDTAELYGQGNTEGRPHVKATDAAYVAGFLDGDGSIHFQLVRQKEYRYGYYIRSSLSFSQATSARHHLAYVQGLLGGAGYLRDRGTGMSDLVITSRPLLIEILTAVQPYVVLKREHVRKALWLLPRLRPRPDPDEFLQLARVVDAFATLNYSKTKRISAADVEQHLRGKGVLAPVTTSSLAQRGDGAHCSGPEQLQIHVFHNTPAPRKGMKV